MTRAAKQLHSPMTVAQLIEELKKLPEYVQRQDVTAMVEGVEERVTIVSWQANRVVLEAQ